MRLLLQQPASLTLAAQRFLGHHEEKVGVGQSLCVKQPGGSIERRGLEVRSTPSSRPAGPTLILLPVPHLLDPLKHLEQFPQSMMAL